MPYCLHDIIIPHFGATDHITDLACSCLRSIQAHSPSGTYRVILIDNGTPDAQFLRIQDAISQLPHLLVRNRLNLGFVKSTNYGIWLSSAPFLVLMNNDTEAAPGWLPALARPLTGRIVASGPRTTARGSWQGRWLPLTGGPIGKQVNGSGDIELDPHRMLAFFCTMFKRDVFSPEHCGSLDEDFGIGLGDDDAFCARIHRRGYRLALVPSLVIPHHHRTTFGALYPADEISQMQKAALEKFHGKVKAGTV